MEFTEYTTRQDQRWDTIAFEVYGDPYAYSALIEVNPQWRSVAQLPAGVVLRIPVVTLRTTLPPSQLPPWRRS